MKKTIILTSTYYKPHFGGIENSLNFLALEYQKLGFNPIIICSDTGLTKKDRLPYFEKDSNDIIVHRFKSYFPKFYLDYFFKYFIEIFRVIKKIKEIERELDIQVVIGRSPETVIGAILAKQKVKYVVPGIAKTQNTLNSNDFKSRFINLFLVSQQSFLQKLALLKAEKVFVFSKNMKDQVRLLLKNKNINTAFINPGVNIEKFDTVAKIEIREFYGIKEEDFVFLIVGRLIKDKGIDIAIKSFSNLKYKNSYLLIVGDGPENKILKDLALELKVSNRVVFTGKVTDGIEKYYKSADCFVMSSIMEPFGQTILEALASSLPIIGWKSGGSIQTATSEIISEGNNGFLVTFSERELQIVMEKMMKLDSVLLNKIHDNNLQLVSQNYTWKNMANNLLK